MYLKFEVHNLQFPSCLKPLHSVIKNCYCKIASSLEYLRALNQYILEGVVVKFVFSGEILVGNYSSHISLMSEVIDVACQAYHANLWLNFRSV